MNKQEILDEINKTKEHLANMEKMLEECNHERWKPKEEENYWYIDGTSSATNTCFIPSFNDLKRAKAYNCFRTREQAEMEAEKILVRRQLEDIARRLNKGQKIDWNNDNQYKYCLVYATDYQHINQDSNINVIRQGTVYCLDKSFKDVAIKEIGQERLSRYLKGK